MSEEAVRVRAIIRGRVQMVGFRAFAFDQGRRLRLHGTVANRPDGSVECVLQGRRADVDAMIERLRTGPHHARVDALDVSEVPAGSDLPPMTVST